MSDTLILGNAISSMEQAPAEMPMDGWTVLDSGVYWQGDATTCLASATIDIVGVADLHALKAHFLLLP